jgi:AbrB family looped-hinge helix DNA binding protein
MKVPIDGVGRLVIPKSLRDDLGITGPTEVELTAADGRLELTVADVPARVEDRDGVRLLSPRSRCDR